MLSDLWKEPYVIGFLKIWPVRCAVFIFLTIFLYIIQYLFLNKGIVFSTIHSILAAAFLVCS